MPQAQEFPGQTFSPDEIEWLRSLGVRGAPELRRRGALRIYRELLAERIRAGQDLDDALGPSFLLRLFRATYPADLQVGDEAGELAVLRVLAQAGASGPQRARMRSRPRTAVPRSA